MRRTLGTVRSLLILLTLVGAAACGRDDPGAPSGGGGDATAPAAQPVGEFVPLRHVLVSHREATPPAPRTREEARARAEEVRRRLQQPGAVFADVAREACDDPRTRRAGGFVGFVGPRSPVPEHVRAALLAARPGEIAPPVETPAGFHVFERLTRDEGRRLEGTVVAPVSGSVLSWASTSKEEAYAHAAAMVRALRGGATLEEAERDRPVSGRFREYAKTGAADAEWQAFERAALALAPGEWADPVETPDAWRVLRREPYFRAEVRHVLVTHAMSQVPEPPTRGRAAAGERAREALAKVKADRKAFGAVVAEYSDEPGAVARGGSIGDVTNAVPEAERLPPEFEGAVAALAPGALAEDVVETRFGFHVLWRVD